LPCCTTALNSKISPNPSLPKRGNKRGLYQRGERERGFTKGGKERGALQRGEREGGFAKGGNKKAEERVLESLNQDLGHHWWIDLPCRSYRVIVIRLKGGRDCGIHLYHGRL